MIEPSGKILLELLLSPDTPNELFGKYKEQVISLLFAGEQAEKKIAELEKEVERLRKVIIKIWEEI